MVTLKVSLKISMIHALCLVGVAYCSPEWLGKSQVYGTQCRADIVRDANSKHLHSVLEELVSMTFFRLAKVDTSQEDDLSCAEFLNINETSFQCKSSDQKSLSSFDATPAVPTEASCSITEDPTVEETFDWDDDERVETVLTENEEVALSPSESFPGAQACAETSRFWKDLCDPPKDSTPHVNLALNPERNTGYNGSSVWIDIYKESAISPSLLSRLVSGWHLSVSVHIANYYSFANGVWQTNSSRLHSSITPSRMDNLQFAFIVLVRALYRAQGFLSSLDYSVGGQGSLAENARTNQLVRHLIGSSVMALCAPVFHGFDEVAVTPEPGLKRAFKRIEKLVRCRVRCKRCRLHAQVAVRGIGAALKTLYSGDPASVLTRDDVVAMINTLHAFSSSLVQIQRFSGQSGPDDSVLDLLAQAGPSAFPSHAAEEALVAAALNGDTKLLALARAYSSDPARFVRLALATIVTGPDLIVVGGGLAGLAAAVALADRGGSVLLFEKEKQLGGNSAKASSGINAAVSDADEALFLRDTLKSAGAFGDPALAQLLVHKSSETLEWLKTRFSLNLDSTGGLGGHSAPRTHRPSEGLVGAELIGALSREARKLPGLKIFLNSPVTGFIADDTLSVTGVIINGTSEFRAPAVLLASGGFGASKRLLERFRPDLATLPATLGSQTTGEVIEMGEALGGDLMDMNQVQVHPTAFVDSKDPSARSKVLAAEILRGVGGLLIDPKTCERFSDELGTRKYVVDRMNATGSHVFHLVLTEDMLSSAPQHKQIYTRRGLLRAITFAELVEDYVDVAALERYNDLDIPDAFGKENRPGVPLDMRPNAQWYIGQVTPAIHYTMGGLRVDAQSRVLGKDGSPIKGLYAVGEVAGGVHGENRLGGNSLLECAVFGRMVGQSLQVKQPSTITSQPAVKETVKPMTTRSEVEKHNTVSDCWVVIYDEVYDLSSYANEHPGGSEAIERVCGRDGTADFASVHSRNLLGDSGFKAIARLQ